MGHDQICAWLQLPNGTWPPDHYTLLGLPPGESDLARIEQQVHERMEKVRVYQLPHPELATEVMNRLAQALICLTDARAKVAYDQKLFPERFPNPPPPPVRREPVAAGPSRSLAWLFGSADANDSQTELPVEPQATLDWETTPPPQRLPADPDAATIISSQETIQIEASAAAASLPTDDFATEQIAGPAAAKPSREGADTYASWRKGLGTRRALHYRILWHRQLLHAWQGAGKYLNRPTRAVHRPAEATDLIHHMQSIRELLGALPLFGVTGPPGCLVVALASQQMIVPTLQTLLSSQREALARDWQAGLKLLHTHRQFLRHELRALKRRSAWRQGLRALKTGLVDHPGIIVLLVACVALNLSYEQVWRRWPEQLLCLLAIVVVRIMFWMYSGPPVRKRPARPVAPPVSSRKTMRRPRKLPNSSRA